MKKIKNSQPQTKFPGSYKKKSVFKITITADIDKAFLQIEIKETDSDVRFTIYDFYRRMIFYRKTLRNKFALLVFGVTSSPFLLKATIIKHDYQYTTADPDYVQKTLMLFFINDFTRDYN